MSERFTTALLAIVCAFAVHNGASAQNAAALRRDVSFLADDRCEGRGTGTVGIERARRYIVDRFKECGLNPMRYSYTSSFRFDDTLIMRNVQGVIYSSKPSDKWIVVCSHYDHLGKIGGVIYNGADDNASGVAALLEVARLCCDRKNSGAELPCNLLFAALDGKERNMAGSARLLESAGIDPRNVVCALNIDIIGTDLVPPHRRKDYVIVLGEETLPRDARGHIADICWRRSCNLDLDLTFYGSRDFTRMMYSLGDHHTFAKKGIPSLFFTSGFHDHTYKATDDTELINFDLVQRRANLIFNFIDYMSGL